MNFATLESSPRLQRVHAILKRGGWWSTRDLLREADVCAVNSCVAELRANGLSIECRHEYQHGRRLFYYRLLPRETLL